MNLAPVEKIVQAVLYEGYILYPYRPSSPKNRERFTFGRVYPRAYSLDQNGAEPCTLQTECLVLVEDEAAEPEIEIHVRFLHPMAREAGRLAQPLAAWTETPEPAYEVVPSLRVDDRIYQTWQEAVEREVGLAPLALRGLVNAPQTMPFAFPASRTLEPVLDDRGQAIGVIVRRQEALDGRVDLRAERIDAGAYRLTVRLSNETPVPEADLRNAERLLLRLFASAHTILGVRGGAFASMTDPPPAYAAAAAACENTGTWPILVGEEGTRDLLLSSPIILYDYPRLAPESAGDLFDGTEIDEILLLRIMTLTEEEKAEMRQVDERARRILQRTESLPEDALLKMHGTMREKRFVDELDPWDPFTPKKPLDEVSVNGVQYRAGARVRIRPKNRADIMDLALAGKTALIEAVEQDFERRIYLALVLEEDPGRDLGMMRQPGHRFFFGPDEVELLIEEDR